MKLGRDELGVPVFLAPLAGVTDKAFRETVRSLGGKYVWTEMISAKALTYGNVKTLQMLDLGGEAGPKIVQLFGGEPETLARGAQVAVEHGADVVDINMGCPMQKVVKNGEGAALLKDLPRAQAVASAVVEAVSVPVTVKFRLGWSHAEIVAVELAKSLESVGVQMLTVHGRTREQFYAGHADWPWIQRVKKEVNIPVIGNGDVFTPEEAARLLAETGCDGVMIGRGALGNPWLIPRTQDYLTRGKLQPEPLGEERREVACAHFERLLRDKGERIGLQEMRKHAVWYMKGIRNAARFREEIMQAGSPDRIRDILSNLSFR